MSSSDKKKLFDGSSSEEDEDCNITINKNYAQRYDEWREAEIKRKLEDRYGNLDEDLSSSSSDDEDDSQELNKAFSKDFFEVISQLRKKDPKIYNPEVQFFNEEEKPEVTKEKKEKPLYLRDYERKLLLERGGVLSDEESDAEERARASSPTIAEKERALKESLQKIVHSDSEDDNDDGFLKKKVKTEAEKKKEEEDYIEWLRGRKQELEDKSLQESLSTLKEEWNNPNLDEGEKFLRDYVLNKRYLDPEDDDVDTGNVTDEDYQDEYMDEFERKYNFRYEEPDSEFLKRYPRTIDSSVRRKDNRRKLHREEVKKRKEEEKLRQREELKVLKSLKRKEIMKKIEQLKEITGNAELGISDKDLEGDYDPEEHDKKMRELFSEDYYEEGNDELQLDELVLPPLEEEIADDFENWDEYDGEKDDGYDGEDNELHCEDPNFNMDCDYDPAKAQLEKEARPRSSRERKKLKRQSRFGTLVRKEKPKFDPNEKSFQQYVDEYYGIDYEDIVGGMPCRFKYRKVMPNSFGLTIDEILAADDKELNAWVSIKKATAIRSDHVERNEQRIYELKAQNEALKRKILPSLYKTETDDVDEDNIQAEKRGKKFKQNIASENSFTEVDKATIQSEKKGKKFKQNIASENSFTEVDKATIQSEKKGKKFKQNIASENSFTEVDKATIQSEKKGKKFKQNIASEDSFLEADNAITSGKKKKKNVKAVLQDNSEETVISDAVELQNEESFSEPMEKSKQKKKKRNSISEEVEFGSMESTTQTNEKKMKKKANKGNSTKVNDNLDEQKINFDGKSTAGAKRKLTEEVDISQKVKKRKKMANNTHEEQDEDLGLQGSSKKIKQNKSNFVQNEPKTSNQSQQDNSSSLKKKRSRSGKTRRQFKRKQENADAAPRDIKAENKARAVRRQKYVAAPVLGDMSDSRLKAYGLNPKKFKNKLVYG